ncbi:MAG: MOSC domain-containing protein [Caldilineales bacterium]
MTATVTSIVYSPQPGSYNRKPLAQAVLLAGYGIDGDRKAGNPKRNLNIMDQETLDFLDAEGIPTGPGVLGENLILEGVRLDAQAPGTRIRIGQEALVEMVELRAPCYKLTALDARMPDFAVGRVGVMARVVEGGVVRVGDAVAIVDGA